MQQYHVLNGDCLAEQLKQTSITPNFIVCRECLVEGNVFANNITDFWKLRTAFITGMYKGSREEYFEKVVNEIEKLNHLPQYSEVCLWFEDDLFCQVNLWFVITVLSEHPTLKIFRVFPAIERPVDIWKGFGIANAEKLEQAYNAKVQLEGKDIELGKCLWESYQNNDFNRLEALSKHRTNGFAYLEEVCRAHIDRFPLGKNLSRPQQVIKEIISTGVRDFSSVFSEFSKREGIYGLGDLQVKRLYDFVLKTCVES
ncbi:hypothetical protein Pedsa_1315 [Pseudopedobacter saltans DSM 12145]|uniref:DUF1835 domain-containing protein n=1 Tax=Pseudopedobacter saltans (strain ATCC 51119 / DSM 12145 / JCM 21818 / CCUG 39354 / LMG 10337 / NBRC 100064 / NCIMB 13643) TaxID=762903 RepID=F0SDY6_PSESL|nr:DUF1835 domain-containing protein [Pseudopedobacter saltans]ADY51882.1 hypothetical protein Pedsa_1315 [Pseudopedobacter saltans DSM 12145]